MPTVTFKCVGPRYGADCAMPFLRKGLEPLRGASQVVLVVKNTRRRLKRQGFLPGV